MGAIGRMTDGHAAARWARVVAAVAVAAVAAGCASEETGRERRPNTSLICDREGIPACVRGGACADAALACSDGCCLPRCSRDADCGAGACGAPSCACDDSICQPVVCSADVDCEIGEVCWGGTCAAMPITASAATCRIEPMRGVIREGVPAPPITVKVFDRDGEPLPGLGVGSPDLTLVSSDPSRGAFDLAGVLRGGRVAGTFAVTARIGGASCTASFVNFAALAPGEVRVIAVDELTGLTIPGATVRFEGPTPASRQTGLDGEAIFSSSALPPVPRTVSVLHDDFTWLTLVGTSESDLLVPLRRSLTPDRAGGFVGRFDERAFDPALLNAGLAGMSIPGNLVDLSFTILLGPVGRFDVELGGARKVDLPQGIVLGLGNTWFKPGFQALGLPGSCEDEAATRDGSCGTWSAWGLAGGMPLEELPIDQLTSGGNSLDVGQVLAHLLPHVRRFHSAVVRDVEFERVPARVVGGEPVPDTARFAHLDLAPTTRLGLGASVSIPELPVASGRVLDGVIVLAGSLAPGRGLVPLGFTAGIDAGIAAGGAPTRKVIEPGGSAGKLQLRLAPAHGGLEGSPFAVVAMAVNFTGLMEEEGGCTVADRSGCASLAALVALQDRFGHRTDLNFPAGEFLGFADGASFDPATREFRLNGGATGDPDLMRLTLGSGARKWTLYFPAGTTSFAIPHPAGMDDRARDARASLQAIRTDSTWSELQGFGPKGLGHLSRWTLAFSTADLPQ